MVLIKKQPTNWENYYQKPSFFAKFTRKTTERILLATLRARHASAPIQTIGELGGGTSCFFSAIRKAFPDVQYTIVDNNLLSAELFKNNHAHDDNIDIQRMDVLTLVECSNKYDVVFSVGLIEHFSVKDTAIVIKNHVLASKPGGLVIITFPTPTWLYKTIRFVSERLNQWIFHDERPLHLDDVAHEVAQHARVTQQFINWGTLLTQGVVVGMTVNH